MTTCVVSGRIDEETRERAGACIRAAGLTTGEVIKRVWESIARTGQLPAEAYAEAEESGRDAFRDFLEFCATRPAAQDGWLATAEDVEIRDAVTSHLLEKYA